MIARRLAAWVLHARCHDPVHPPWVQTRIRAHLVENFPTRGALCGFWPGMALVLGMDYALYRILFLSPYCVAVFLALVCVALVAHAFGWSENVLLCSLVAVFRRDVYHMAEHEVMDSLTFHERMDHAFHTGLGMPA